MAASHPLSTGRVRIGELASRVGVSPTLLRAWERRYGLLRPIRTAGGFRLYGPDDERRVRAMQALLSSGLAARQAAEAVLSIPDPDPGDLPLAGPDPGPARIDVGRSALAAAMAGLDDAGAHAALDRLLAAYGATTVISEAILPYLADVGDRWAAGSPAIAEEHFASSLLRGRLLGLARGWDGGDGPRALLACPSGELHDLGLICFGIALRGHGWRITYLGADTPPTTLVETASHLVPRVTVLAATSAARLRDLAGEIQGAATPLALAGRGATPEVAVELGAMLLDADPVAAADRVAAEMR